MSAEIKEVIEKLGHQFNEFKTEIDARQKAIEAKGHVDPLLQEKLDKMAEGLSAIDAMKAECDTHAETVAELKAKHAELEEQLNTPISIGNGETIIPKELKQKTIEFLRTGDPGIRAEVNEKHAAICKALGKSLNLTVQEEGAIFYSTTTDPALIPLVRETTPMRQIATIKTIGGSAYERMKQTGAAAGGWVGEREARPETTAPTYAKKIIEAHEQYANPAVTQQMLEDPDFDIEAELNMDIARTFSINENTAFVVGNGEKKPRGFLTYATSTTPGTEELEYIPSGGDGVFAATSPHTLFDTVIGTLKDEYHANARWMIKRALLAEVMKMVDDQKQLIWQPSLQQGMPSLLRGFPITRANDMPAKASNSLSIAFGDFRAGYTIVDRRGVRLVRDPYTNKPFVMMYTTMRVGGDVMQHEAIKVVKFATT